MKYLETTWQFHKLVNIRFPHAPAILLLGIHLRKMKIYPHIDSHRNVHTSIIPNSQRWKQFIKTLTDDCIKKMWYINIMGYFSVMKNNAELPWWSRG